MRRLIFVALLAALLVVPSGANAHPLGNFTVNHLSRVSVSSDRVDVLYVLDQAEIPTFQERDVPREELLERKRAEVRENLELVVDGRPIPLEEVEAPSLEFRPGQGGLEILRVELSLRAGVEEPRKVELRDETFADRQGLKAIISEPGEGTTVRTDAPSGDPTEGLRRYPQDILASPINQTSATFSVEPGDGTLIAPESPEGEATTTRGGGDGFAAVFENAAAGEGALLFLLVAAFAWGGFHALSPGHGKAMVAAYLVGTRGTARHAVALGATVTITHTIGVFALGVVTLALSQYVLPEDLYPWLSLVSGLLVVTIGVGVLRSRIRWGRKQRAAAEEHGHWHEDAHDHSHGDSHSHEHGHSHGHGRGHSHHIPDRITTRGLIAMGASAGLIPCPSALVVLVAAISQHQLVLGLVLIVTFSLGLAGTLTVLGLLVTQAGRATSRLRFSSRVTSALPAASAVVIVGVGCVLTARALPQIV